MARTYHPRGVLVDGYRVREHPSYATWFLMLQRCTNPKASGFKNYGGRGITVCERWRHFVNFAADMGLKPGDEFSIDRTDNALGYGPDNCRWATRDLQNSNKRIYATSTTGVSGVRMRDGKYQVRIIENGKRVSLGNYNTIEEAVAAKAGGIRSKTCSAKS